ncbi:MAG: hypothetical protein EI684_16275 [Candidatus Viridilinea halotolerans]|uniref:YfhO family protein n=1 Tax=Candidatus Viridilinea halotolerans TaxID=2491704 RepID=A0A426TUZ4_9CHLR|nr:MAG: hypothetical protein EI684_16275 [Candidatus Viridilinea halotolerans]
MAQQPHNNPLTAVPPPEPWRWHAGVLLFYLIVGVVYTWPLVLHWQTGAIQIWPYPVDAGQGIWNLWWARTTLLNGENPYQLTRYLFYPAGAELFWQTLSLPNALLVLPILLIFGPVVAFNSLTLLSFVLGGYLVYRLARALHVGPPAALIAGFVYVCSPYHMQQLHGGPLELITIQWIPLSFLALMYALQRPSLWRTLLATVALLLTTLASQYYGLYTAIIMVCHVALVALQPQGSLGRWRVHWPQAAVGLSMLSLWAATLLFFFVGSLEAVGQFVPQDWYMRQVFHAVALVDLLFPNILHPLWGAPLEAMLLDLHHFGVDTGMQLGLGISLLLVVALVRQWRTAWPWALLGLISLIFALGPKLQITDSITGIPMPFMIFNLSEVFRNSSRPAIFVAVLMLPVSLLCALGWQALLQGRTLAQIMFGLWLAFELLPGPMPIIAISSDPHYALLNADPVPGALLPLPAAYNDSRAMLHQFCHGRALVGGYLARTPPNPLIAATTQIHQLLNPLAATRDIVTYPLATELRTLGIRYLTLSPTQMPPDELQRLHALLAVPGVRRIVDTPELAIYQVAEGDLQPLVLPMDGWHAVEHDGQRTWRWMGAKGIFQVLTPQDATVTLRLIIAAYDESRTLTFSLNEQMMGRYEIPTGHEREINLRLALPAGTHRLGLHSNSTDITPEGREVSFKVSDVQTQGQMRPSDAAPLTSITPPPMLPRLPAPWCADTTLSP